MVNIAASFFNRARQDPSAPALTFANRTLTFAELADRARRLAASLRADPGTAPGGRVAIWMENRAEFLEVLLACWTAGLCAVPLNAKLHQREVVQLLADCGACAVFASESHAADLAGELASLDAAPGLHVVDSAAYRRRLDVAPMDCAPARAEDLAWLFYTSGTTGRSKGAMLSHRNLMFMSLAYGVDIEQVGPGDVSVNAAPLSHGAGLYGLPHLIAGGHQVVLPGFDPQAVLDCFARYRNVSMFAAPTMITRLLGVMRDDREAGGLRTICYGGGPMYVSDLLRALDRFGPRLYQLYGQGESPMTIAGLSRRDHEGDRGAEHLARLGSCGIARTGVEVRVVDEAGRDVPPGEAGEVITRSDCVMSGYWNNPAATAGTLRDGWLWTGDIGALDTRGYLTLKDRSKDVVISGGSNIYTREVEEVLLRHPAVLECSVVARPHPDWGEEAIAFVVAQPGMAVASDELDALCLDNIARFKRPKAYRFVASLPKNNYGKVLKISLRQALAAERGDA